MEPRSRRGRRLGALAVLGLGLAVAAAGEDGGDAGAAAPYQASEPGERSGRTVDPGTRAAETSEPSFGAATLDLDARPGASRELHEVARPPGPKPVPPADETEGPAFLRLPRRPGEGASAERSLSERLCVAEQDLDHARREHERALRDYKRMQHGGYPRGPAKLLVIEHRDLTGRRLERAEKARDALLAEASEQGLELDPDACGTG
jgi:hypothetical protein